MLGRDDEARDLLLRAADEYDTSWRAAPPGSWGRPIAMIRCRLMAGDHEGARADASAAVEAGALDAPGPDRRLLRHARSARRSGATRRPRSSRPGSRTRGSSLPSVADALGALARADGAAYEAGRRAVLRSFEERDAFLEDVGVADTVLVLDALAAARGLELPPLSSPLLPG